MDEQNKIIEDAVEELKGADEVKLKEVIEKWFQSTRNDGMKIGARFISAAVYGVIEKHLKKGKDASKRDFERCIKDVLKIVSVQLNTQQNDLEDDNDGTAEEIG